jgi:predicted ATP-grasp superfamily ATP-dependent carboligase
VPRAVAVRRHADLGKLHEIRFPAVVKPGAKDFFFTHKAPRACRVSSRDEAVSICRNLLPHAPDLIVQEWIEGEDSDIYFCLQYRGAEGRVVASFTGRKLRSWPPRTGNTLSCCAAPEAAPALEPLTNAFFVAVQCEGMCSLEFKRDARTGEFLMIEPTVGRSDWQEEIATLCGVNIPLAAYWHELGRAAVTIRQNAESPPVIWRAPTCYWRSVLVTRSIDHVPPNGRIARAAWRLDDPAPVACYWLLWGRRFLARSWRSAAASWRRWPRRLPEIASKGV